MNFKLRGHIKWGEITILALLKAKALFESRIPLAERIRPATIDDLIGQEHLIGKEGVLRKVIQTGSIPSMILWGPPGVGKTTIANIIANQVKSPFFTLSAVSAGVKDVREVIQKANRLAKAILFIDEIHRFNKSQQDALLSAVEKGIITLIGATTENPSFEVNSALLSRCQVYTLQPLTEENLLQLLARVLKTDNDLKEKKITFKEHGALLNLSGGDARKLLNLVELVADSAAKPGIKVTDKMLIGLAQQRVAIYDKGGEQHYDIISAFIKSIRGSDPNAGLYYLARMIEGGEDVKFIARRLLILASEDIGNANPTALVLATSCFQAVNVIGYPEAEIILAQCVTYLAASPKSNASYMAIKDARRVVKDTGDLQVPMQIRNAPTKLMKEQGYGKGYKYAHSYAGSFIHQEYLPEEIANTKFYEPANTPRENELRKQLQKLWQDKYGY
jgi:putative ATPase